MRAEGPRGSRARRRALGWAAVLVAATVSLGASTRLGEPPRYDGAGYAMLGRALAEGRGYRDLGHPEAPPHAHFPPGYPSALGLLWRASGRPSTASAHLFSAACGLVAVGATCRWWRGVEPRLPAFLLGLALAVNWGWGRLGGSIQSEPMYLALGGLTLLLASRAGRLGGIGNGAALGVALGAGVLTRHVGVCLALAVGADLWLRGRRGSVAWAAVVGSAMVGPWVAWQLRAGPGTQAGLFRVGEIPSLVGQQAIFYARRIPDAIAGPFVEAATVFGRSPIVEGVANGWAVAASGVVVFGWARMLRSPRRRLGALIPLATLALLLVWPFTEAGRFLVPLVPFLLMGAAEGTAPILRALGSRRPRSWAAGMVLMASMPYATYAIIADRAGAQRRTHEDFDAACRWLAGPEGRPGPVMARHPGDVFWLTGRQAVAIPEGDRDAIDRAIDRYRVAYLLVDEARYAKAPASPLSSYLAGSPGRARPAWRGRGSVSVHEVVRAPAEGTSP